MKKLFLFLIAIVGLSTAISAQNWKNDNNDSYYCGGGGMMWNNDDNDYCYGPNMMGGYWMDNGWHKYGQSSLNLTQQQQEQWNKVSDNGRANQQAVNDSINYHCNEIRRFPKAKTSMAPSDFIAIKTFLPPDQYTQFLLHLVTVNAH